MSNKVRSQNILLSLDDKQTEASGSESYGSFRSSRSRGPAAGQREPRKPHGENNGIQEHGGRRYPSGPRPPPRAAPTRNGQSAQEKQPVAAAPPAEESKIDPKEKFSLDFPALS